jgi:HAD superfamily hydrolase (TIGR01509 family)
VTAAPETLPAAVLWDLDGTLVDTEPYWVAAEYDLVAEHGGTWSDADAHALIGNDLLVSGEYIRRHGRVDLPAAEIVERLVDRVEKALRERVPWRPGARELLAELLAANVPCALVTMSYARIVAAVLAALPPGAFAAVVTGDQVRHGKPHPEPYLRAAELLGMEPDACVAIEDSRTGVASAEAAGVPVIAVPDLVSIPSGPGRMVLGTLSGVSAGDLASLAQRVRDVRAHRGS